MNEGLTISIVLFIAGILMLLLRKRPDGILGALMGYGTWKLKTPQHFEAAYKVAGSTAIIYSILSLSLFYFFPELMGYQILGIPNSIIILFLFSVLLFPLISFELNEIDRGK